MLWICEINQLKINYSMWKIAEEITEALYINMYVYVQFD